MGNTPFVTGYNIVGVIQHLFYLVFFFLWLLSFFFYYPKLPQTTTWVYQSKLSKLENITLILQSNNHYITTITGWSKLPLEISNKGTVKILGLTITSTIPIPYL